MWPAIPAYGSVGCVTAHPHRQRGNEESLLRAQRLAAYQAGSLRNHPPNIMAARETSPDDEAVDTDVVVAQVSADRELERQALRDQVSEDPRPCRNRPSTSPAETRSVKRAKHSGPPFKKQTVKVKNYHHRPYDKCKPGTRAKRGELLSRIDANWDTPWHDWIRPAIAPKRDEMVGSGRSAKLQTTFLEPRDWSTTLLSALERLPMITKSNGAVAQGALDEAVADRRQNRQGGQALIAEDVEVAIVILSESYQPEPRRERSPTLPREPEPALTPPATLDATPLSPLHSPRSPRCRMDTQIKSEETRASPFPRLSAAQPQVFGEKLEEIFTLMQEEAEVRARRKMLEAEQRILFFLQGHGSSMENAISGELMGD